jgi:predicted PurR-regulated permease PerM
LLERKYIQQIALLAAAAGALGLCLLIALPFLWPLLSAGALAVLFYPVHLHIRARLRHESLAATFSLLLVIVLLAVPAGWIVSRLYEEIAHLYAGLKSQSAAWGGWMEWAVRLLERPLAPFGLDAEEIDSQLRTFFTERLQTLSGTLLQIVRGLVTNLAVFLANTIFTLIILFFLLRDGDDLIARARDFLPIDNTLFDRLLNEVGRSVLANLYGIAAVALAQGGLTSLLFFSLGLPSPVVWGVVAAFFSMIPVVGPPAVWVPAAIVLAAAGNWGKAAVVTFSGIAVIGMADNVIRPWIISGRIQLHPLLVFIARAAAPRHSASWACSSALPFSRSPSSSSRSSNSAFRIHHAPPAKSPLSRRIF